MGNNGKRFLVSAVCAAALAVVFSAPGVAAEKAAPVDMAKLRAAAGVPTPASQLPAAPANGEMAFVISDFTPALYPGWDSCPKGWAMTNQEEFLTTVPPAERKRLLLHENEPELTERWKAYTNGPNNTNVCANYDKFPDRPLQAMVQSKIGYGVNLDGDTGKSSKDPYVCSHQKFTSPSGDNSVDNQTYRVLGCNRFYRGPDGGNGEEAPGAHGVLATGQFTVVLILRGVHSLVNDDNVQVILASSDQQPIVDSQQNFIANASYTVTSNPRWRHVLQGHIVNGVLTTDSHDILLLRAKGQRGLSKRDGAGSNWEWDFERSKLQLAFRSDGSLQGVFGGYELPVDLLRQEIGGGRGTAQVAGVDCASKYDTMLKMADGGRDPATGKCTRLSNAYFMTAAPAFVFDQPAKSIKSADAK